MRQHDLKYLIYCYLFFDFVLKIIRNYSSVRKNSCLLMCDKRKIQKCKPVKEKKMSLTVPKKEKKYASAGTANMAAHYTPTFCALKCQHFPN